MVISTPRWFCAPSRNDFRLFLTSQIFLYIMWFSSVNLAKLLQFSGLLTFLSSFSRSPCRSAGRRGREADAAGLQHGEGNSPQLSPLATPHTSELQCGICAPRFARLTGRSVERWSCWRTASPSGASPTKHPAGPKSSSPVSSSSTRTLPFHSQSEFVENRNNQR